ncbi:MAG: ribosome biogenesis GTPase Der [Myxococcota bacterium]
MNALPIVAIVGRPNVGKSTLFNRLVGGSRAIVENTPGVTRDRHYASLDLCGRRAIVVDTGGFLGGEAGEGRLAALVRDQVKLAVDEAEIVLLVVDARAGVTPADRDLARMLRRSGKPFLAVANKVDHASVEAEAHEAYELGADAVIAVSAAHGRNIADLTDALETRLGPPARPIVDEEPVVRPIRLAIVGRPNAGKSSLLNAIVGQARTLVHDAPGTTRDPIDVDHEHAGTSFRLVDTAGIRKRRSSAEPSEQIAILRALRAAAYADVCALVIDAGMGIGTQDAHIAGVVTEEGRALVLVMNKWDLVQGRRAAAEDGARAQVAERLPFAAHAPLVLVSARTGLGVTAVLDATRTVYGDNHRHIPTAALNRLLREAVAGHAPPSPAGRPLRFYYIAQAKGAPPTFVISTNRPEDVADAYRRYLANQIRERYGFHGSPIRLQFRAHREK